MAKDLHATLVQLLREENKELTKKVKRLQDHMGVMENNLLRKARQAMTAEDDREALYNAVRVLALVVPNTTGVSRKARKDARKLLEDRKLPTPHTLGSSRKRVSKKKKKKKVLTKRSRARK
jgi:hypothetical protein